MIRRLVFTVTNDLVFDQRMIRICGSLAQSGYQVTLVGRFHRGAPELIARPFQQKRLHCFFRKGFLFYAEYSMRLFLYLLFKKMDLVCAIDLDTILPCYLVSRLRKKQRVYDAHELFCEMKEVVSRPRLYRFWKWVERNTVPHFRYGYTVNGPIRDLFEKEYGVRYAVIRNLPVLDDRFEIPEKGDYILYQGAVNEGRSFETLIPAFQFVKQPLWIYGDGNFLNEAMRRVQQHGLGHKVFFKGKLPPEALKEVTRKAVLGITLFENNGLNNYLSLANRFFDYMHAAVPQLCVAYPAYTEINAQFEVAELISDLSPEQIAARLNALIHDTGRYRGLQQNCLLARQALCWQKEEQLLLHFYKDILHDG
jgi:glycosyltransferase involved in cell wall biosynthesis